MGQHGMDPSAPLTGTPSKKTKRKLKYEMRKQLISFVFMIFLTSMAFISIASDAIPATFAIPFILLLAVIQVVLQLYVFMHLNERGNGWTNIMIWTGVLIAILTVATLMLLIGVRKW
ncbi:cytochrome C oxidase subunit IV family protein [Evansella cellulosilytica]|uniref:Cytochrome C oxidase subunit IV n=1 Tax=Evansella cellulosilytica (strain ATCC 21833 / DSM 2522 / FERM P-1141 / JCM 9156 / N-4) TaxID=649639 RepID=E6TUK4_EVAC2|nr:cytochrome C oxidase subunit IV family protein [Evansella cellulosilytica]ADU30894.1 cytochrome C oxidase subunit IV [Evansella cellulosilytica DSM 2522]